MKHLQLFDTVHFIPYILHRIFSDIAYAWLVNLTSRDFDKIQNLENDAIRVVGFFVIAKIQESKSIDTLTRKDIHI